MTFRCLDSRSSISRTTDAGRLRFNTSAISTGAAFGSLDEACDPNLAIKLDCLKIISLEQKWTTFLVRTSVTSVK